MNWILPPQMLPFGAAMAMGFVWPRLRQPTSSTRLIAEVLAVTFSVIVTECALWALYWWIEQRW